MKSWKNPGRQGEEAVPGCRAETRSGAALEAHQGRALKHPEQHADSREGAEGDDCLREHAARRERQYLIYEQPERDGGRLGEQAGEESGDDDPAEV